MYLCEYMREGTSFPLPVHLSFCVVFSPLRPARKRKSPSLCDIDSDSDIDIFIDNDNDSDIDIDIDIFRGSTSTNASARDHRDTDTDSHTAHPRVSRSARSVDATKAPAYHITTYDRARGNTTSTPYPTASPSGRAHTHTARAARGRRLTLIWCGYVVL